jgi:hypothetical protein
MKKSFFIFLIISVFATLFSCKKDAVGPVLSATQTAPTLTMPTIVLSRTTANDSLVFTGSVVDYGINIVQTYTLEMDTTTGNFENPIILGSGAVDTFKMTVVELNTKIVQAGLPVFVQNKIKFRIKSSVSPNYPALYSAVTELNLTPYGDPRLNLSTVPIQNIQSPANDGVFYGFLKFTSTATTFTLTNPETNVTYGGTGGVLSVDGPAIAAPGTGYYDLKVNTTAMTYVMAPSALGVVGSATPNGWNIPDQKMDFDIRKHFWYITTDMEPHLDGTMKCEFKFRKNDAWAWNLGGPLTALTQGGVNIVVANPGVYNIKLYINADGKTGSATMTKH